MKYFALVLLSMNLFVGCVSTPVRENVYSYSYMKNFVVGKTTESEMIKALGTPIKRVSRDDYYSLDFNDPQTGFQRISANFSQTDSRLISLLWIPSEKDPEISLSSAMENKDPSAFKVEVSETDKVHGISAVKFYVNDSGKTIRYNEGLKQVEGIAFFDPTRRMPSSKKSR